MGSARSKIANQIAHGVESTLEKAASQDAQIESAGQEPPISPEVTNPQACAIIPPTHPENANVDYASYAQQQGNSQDQPMSHPHYEQPNGHSGHAKPQHESNNLKGHSHFANEQQNEDAEGGGDSHPPHHHSTSESPEKSEEDDRILKQCRKEATVHVGVPLAALSSSFIYFYQSKARKLGKRVAFYPYLIAIGMGLLSGEVVYAPICTDRIVKHRIERKQVGHADNDASEK